MVGNTINRTKEISQPYRFNLNKSHNMTGVEITAANIPARDTASRNKKVGPGKEPLMSKLRIL
jgi:hypothetical protein